MDTESLRETCLSLPHATEDMQWGNNLLFRISGKFFALLDLDENCLSIKCTAEKFAELVEQDGIIPAPYLARYNWVCLEQLDALSHSEIKDLIRQSYRLVLAKLPKKMRVRLSSDFETQ